MNARRANRNCNATNLFDGHEAENVLRAHHSVRGDVGQLHDGKRAAKTFGIKLLNQRKLTMALAETLVKAWHRSMMGTEERRT
jgi:hypothetical protein